MVKLKKSKLLSKSRTLFYLHSLDYTLSYMSNLVAPEIYFAFRGHSLNFCSSSIESLQGFSARAVPVGVFVDFFR